MSKINTGRKLDRNQYSMLDLFVTDSETVLMRKRKKSFLDHGNVVEIATANLTRKRTLKHERSLVIWQCILYSTVDIRPQSIMIN